MPTAKKHKSEPKHKEVETTEPEASAAEPMPEVKAPKARILSEELTPAKEGFNRSGVHVLDCVRAALERGKVNGIALEDIDAMAEVAAKLEGFLPHINALFPKKEKPS